MRSWLFVPGDDTRKLGKSLNSGSDVVIIDLEDSVAAENKGKARKCAFQFLKDDDRHAAPSRHFVRINPLGSQMAESDLDFVMTAKPDGIVLPKCQSGEDVTRLDAKLSVREALHDIPAGRTQIMAIATETAASVFSLGTYGNAGQRLCGLAWGGEDLAVETGALSTKNPDGGWTEPFRMVRNLCLFGAASANVGPVDTVYTDFRNHEGLKYEAEIAARDGFTGKLAIHPDQVPIINAAFTPSDDAIQEAKEIIAIFDALAETGEAGVTSHRGKMLDRPHLLAARRLVKNAEKFVTE